MLLGGVNGRVYPMLKIHCAFQGALFCDPAMFGTSAAYQNQYLFAGE